MAFRRVQEFIVLAISTIYLQQNRVFNAIVEKECNRSIQYLI